MKVLLTGAAGQLGQALRQQVTVGSGASTASRAAPTGLSRPSIPSAPMAAPRPPARKPWSRCWGQALGVVEDQVGCPTSSATLAAACWRVITTELQEPVLHWCDAGAASWFDVAVAVGELAQELGLVQQPAPVNPLTTAEYSLPAQRPSYSLLDCSSSRRALGLAPTPWRQALRQLLEALG